MEKWEQLTFVFPESNHEPEILPWIQETKRYLEKEGKPSYWITEVVDTTEFGAVFIKDGKPGYKSECPYYSGYWTSGGIGSVQCNVYDKLLPGLQWYEVCRKNPSECAFFKRAQKGIDETRQEE